jgi:hypothetical protein
MLINLLSIMKSKSFTLEMTIEVVHFNVGGTLYDVARDTLLKAPDTFLAKLVSDKWNEGQKQEIIFIDRDG